MMVVALVAVMCLDDVRKVTLLSRRCVSHGAGYCATVDATEGAPSTFFTSLLHICTYDECFRGSKETGLPTQSCIHIKLLDNPPRIGAFRPARRLSVHYIESAIRWWWSWWVMVMMTICTCSSGTQNQPPFHRREPARIARVSGIFLPVCDILFTHYGVVMFSAVPRVRGLQELHIPWILPNPTMFLPTNSPTAKLNVTLFQSIKTI